MIFVTVGTQGPFDRLIRALDEWAGATQNRDVFAQIGRGAWRPRHLEWVHTLPPEDFDRRLQSADLIVSHAGTGTMIKALEMGKRILVLPRRSDHAEQRNDHQVATAHKFRDLGFVGVAMDVHDLVARLDRFDDSDSRPSLDVQPSPGLLEAIRGIIFTARDDGAPPRIMAVSSGGGHWFELVRLTKGLRVPHITYVTVDQNLQRDVPKSPLFTLPDANRQTPLHLLRLAFESAAVVHRVRPDVVISTGAAPGYVAMRMARALGAKTIWVDSLANCNELSLSGRLAGRFCDPWLTQWAELAGPDGPAFAGSILGSAASNSLEREP